MRYVTSIERLAMEEGMQQGMQQGIQQGMQQGIQQGMQRGQIRTLSRLLASRFGELPEWVSQRLADASEADLDAWTEAIYRATSLEEIFGAPPQHERLSR